MRHDQAELYECEICGTRFRQAAEALQCEAGGRPQPQFHPGDQVMLQAGDYARQFSGERFRVRSSEVCLDRPGLSLWHAGEPGGHMVTYVIESEQTGSRITFVPEQHLGAPGQAEARHA